MRGVWTIAIAKNSANQDAAWEFATWLSGKEFGAAAVKFPSATSAIHSPRVSDGRALARLDPSALDRADQGWTLDGRVVVAKARARELRLG